MWVNCSNHGEHLNVKFEFHKADELCSPEFPSVQCYRISLIAIFIFFCWGCSFNLLLRVNSILLVLLYIIKILRLLLHTRVNARVFLLLHSNFGRQSDFCGCEKGKKWRNRLRSVHLRSAPFNSTVKGSKQSAISYRNDRITCPFHCNHFKC